MFNIPREVSPNSAELSGGTLCPAHLRRQTVALVSSPFRRPVRLWVLDRLLDTSQGPVPIVDRYAGETVSPSESIGLAFAFLGMAWRSILARARGRHHARQRR